MIDYMQLFRFLDEPWEPVVPPVENKLTPEELNHVGGGHAGGKRIDQG